MLWINFCCCCFTFFGVTHSKSTNSTRVDIINRCRFFYCWFCGEWTSYFKATDLQKRNIVFLWNFILDVTSLCTWASWHFQNFQMLMLMHSSSGNLCLGFGCQSWARLGICVWDLEVNMGHIWESVLDLKVNIGHIWESVFWIWKSALGTSGNLFSIWKSTLDTSGNLFSIWKWTFDSSGNLCFGFGCQSWAAKHTFTQNLTV